MSQSQRKDRTKALVAASFAGLMAVAGVLSAGNVAYADKVKCEGVNKCANNTDCGGAGHSCHNQNSCKGKGWLYFPDAELCERIGGTVK